MPQENYYQFTQNDVNWHGFILTVAILDCQHFSTCTQSLVLSSSPEVMTLCGVISLCFTVFMLTISTSIPAPVALHPK